MGYSLISSDNGLLYVAGTTSSLDFPTLNSYDHSYHGGSTHYGDMFLSCMTQDLSQVLASTYLGGNNEENAGELLMYHTGAVIISGSSKSIDFPITNDSYDSTHNGDADVFLSLFQAGLCENDAPEKPIIEGPSTGKVGESLLFSTSTEDINGNDVWFLFDWGDNTDSEWIGPYDSGESCDINHIWIEKQDYTVRVKAKDGFGLESDWSESLIVSMPKIKELNLMRVWLQQIVSRMSFIELLLD
jgi:hypothetical protein